MLLVGGKCPGDAVANMNPKLIRQKSPRLRTLIFILGACDRPPLFGMYWLCTDQLCQHQHAADDSGNLDRVETFHRHSSINRFPARWCDTEVWEGRLFNPVLAVEFSVGPRTCDSPSVLSGQSLLPWRGQSLRPVSRLHHLDLGRRAASPPVNFRMLHMPCHDAPRGRSARLLGFGSSSAPPAHERAGWAPARSGVLPAARRDGRPASRVFANAMINTASAFPPRAHSAGLLDSGQSCSTEVLMRRIGLAVALTFSLLGPLAAEAQQSAKI